MKTTLLTLTCLMLFACHGHRQASPVTEIQQAASLIDGQWPQNPAQYRTTASHIYLANLDAAIDSLQGHSRHSPTIEQQARLAGSLYQRFRILGDLADALKAETISIALATENPDSITANLTASRILSGMHRFEQAREYLSLGRSAGATAEQTDALQRQLDAATGLTGAETAILKADTMTLADADLQENRLLDATRHYRSAEFDYRGSDPYFLAWIQLQQGIAFLRYGDTESARIFFQTAHERFPEYYLATEHLAETEYLLGNLTRAEALYSQVSEQTDNPLFLAQLSRVQRDLGKLSVSRQTAARAEAGFDDLLAQRPELIADHAISHFLDSGRGQKALELARTNMAIRQDVSSWISLAIAADETGNIAESCQALASAKATGQRPVEMEELIARLQDRCRL